MALAKLPGLLNNLVVQARPKLQVAAKYALAELTPPKPTDIPAITSGINKIIRGARTGAWKNTSVKEAWQNSLIVIEVWCWFFIGECIGKRHIVGYKV